MLPLFWMPGAVNFFSYLLCIYPYFFTFTYTLLKNISLIGCPQPGCPGPSQPPAPPLHATVDRCVVSPVCAVACRRSWMPGANEVLGCPQVKNFSINSSAKFLRPFLVVSPN